jgi:hypothetical protein
MAGLDKYLTTTPKKPKNPLDRYLQTNPQPNQSESLKLLDQYYKGSQQQLDENHEAATQKADIAYQKAQNYMPIINKQNGLSGLGVSESARLDMHNKHLNRQSGIDSTYDSASRDLFQNYLTDRTAQLDREYQRAWNEEERAFQRSEAQRQEEQQRQQLNYERLLSSLQYGAFSDFDHMANEINRAYWDGKISKDDYDHLVRLHEAGRTSPEFKHIKNNTYWLEDNQPMPEVKEEEIYPYRRMLEDMSKWYVADRGGSYTGAFNNDAVVKAPNGQNLTIDQLNEILTTQEGMSDDEAEELIVQLQKKLGITPKGLFDFDSLSEFAAYTSNPSNYFK